MTAPTPSAPHDDPSATPLVRIRRAGRVESAHRGRYVLLEGDRVRAAGGDRDEPLFVRSAAKPIQALVGVTSGAVDRFALDRRSLAVATGSHSAGSAHLEAVQATLHRAGVPMSALQCGGHWSIDPQTARAQVLPEGASRPPALWSNCSGKHAMMLAAARALDAPLDTYLTPHHPVQVAILETFADLCGVAKEEIPVAIDGCGAPAPCLPLERMARALQRFAHPDALSGDLRDAATRAAQAMRQHPDLVAGPRRFDTDLMQAGNGRVLSKCGAEGIISVLVPERELVLVVKVQDGGDRGYRMFVVQLLSALGVLDEAATEVLSARHAPEVVRNHAGTVVGSAEAILPEL